MSFRDWGCVLEEGIIINYKHFLTTKNFFNICKQFVTGNNIFDNNDNDNNYNDHMHVKKITFNWNYVGNVVFCFTLHSLRAALVLSTPRTQATPVNAKRKEHPHTSHCYQHLSIIQNYLMIWFNWKVVIVKTIMHD